MTSRVKTVFAQRSRKVLNDLLHEQWEYSMRTSPIYASILGDKRWNDQLDDFSQAAIDDLGIWRRTISARNQVSRTFRWSSLGLAALDPRGARPLAT